MTRRGASRRVPGGAPRRVPGRFPGRRPVLAPVMAALATALSTLAALLLPAAPAHADAIRDQQWSLSALDAQRAWQVSRGRGVTVAVLDTGVDPDHPDLTGQVLPGRDFIGFGAAPGASDWARHGTAMAGIIAGHGHGPGGSDGVMGIAPEAKILPVRVILEDSDPMLSRARDTRGAALAEGIRWAVGHGADVINLSLGDDSRTAHPDAQEDDAVQYALDHGVVVVASAGNSGQRGNPVSYPAAYPGVIAVAAVDRSGVRAPFSTAHWYDDIGAPGVDVVIADPNGHYYDGWGTSMACAYVSGVVALIRSAYPRLSPGQIRDVLERTAVDRPPGGRDDQVGAGMVDPSAALAAAAKLAPLPERPAAASSPRRYFGPGPFAGAAGVDSAGGDALSLVGAVSGCVLLAAGGLLWSRDRRRSRPGDGWPR